MKLKKAQLEKIILGIIVSVTTVIILSIFVFKPRFKKMGILTKEIKEMKEKVQDAQDEVFKLSRYTRNIKSMEEMLALYKGETPEATADWLLGRLNVLGSETEINYDKMDPQGFLLQIEFYKLQAVVLEFKTNYHRLGQFIQKLEQGSHFLKIISLKIKQNEKDKINHNIELTVGAFIGEEEV